MTIIKTAGQSGQEPSRSDGGPVSGRPPQKSDQTDKNAGQTIEEVKLERKGRSSLLSQKENVADQKSDQAVRPDSLLEYIGQSRLKAMLDMSISAAKSRGEPLDHVLFTDRPDWARRPWHVF